MPISEIRVGDVYKNPLFISGVGFAVVQINRKERMVKIQPVSMENIKPIGKPFWKSNRDRIFSECWRVLRGFEVE